LKGRKRTQTKRRNEKLKMSKFRIAVLLLLAVTVVYAVMLALNLWYHSQIETEGFDSDLGHWFGTLDPFFTTSGGFMFFMAGVVLFFMWFIVAFRRQLWKNKDKKKLLALALFFLLTFILFSSIKTVNPETVNPETSTPLIQVGVLCAGDEEFMANPGNMADVESAIHNANTFTSLLSFDSFELTFGIHFEVAGWVTWDSDDNVHNAALMAYEVWTETGFKTGMEYNGHIIEMLCACTGQDIDDYLAVTFPNANITLIETGVAGNFGAIRHEFSHQFDCPECNNVCVMNIVHCLDHLYPERDWCPNCKDWIQNHKYKWTYQLNISTSSGGTTNPAPGTYTYGWGSSVTVMAIPDSGCTFECWLLDGAIVHNNPITITMNSDHTLKAYFSKPLCAMKTKTDGYFYVPIVASSLLKIDFTFTRGTGDQTGGTSPYPIILDYPDGIVDISDILFVSLHFGKAEGEGGFTYMGDVAPDGIIDIGDILEISLHYGELTDFNYNFSGVTVTFSTGEEKIPDSNGYVTIPQGATNFTVKRNGTPIGAMITFW
jgi:hypothetical protein